MGTEDILINPQKSCDVQFTSKSIVVYPRCEFLLDNNKKCRKPSKPVSLSGNPLCALHGGGFRCSACGIFFKHMSIPNRVKTADAHGPAGVRCEAHRNFSVRPRASRKKNIQEEINPKNCTDNENKQNNDSSSITPVSNPDEAPQENKDCDLIDLTLDSP